MASDKRLTYKSGMGDYGYAGDCWQENSKYEVWNKLGAYEDIGTPEEFRMLMIMHREYMADKERKPPTSLMKIFDEINESLDRIMMRKEVRDGSN